MPLRIEIQGGANRQRTLANTCQGSGDWFRQKNLDQIFRPFERLHGVNKYEGIGMGLAICKTSWRAIKELSPQKANSVTEPVSYLPCQQKPLLKS
jgi:light-regulated signal transduction histidine kinase (bacteriophytochrome)